jgi:hypothetical protein
MFDQQQHTWGAEPTDGILESARSAYRLELTQVERKAGLLSMQGCRVRGGRGGEQGCTIPYDLGQPVIQ